jgi:hypothetical protein
MKKFGIGCAIFSSLFIIIVLVVALVGNLDGSNGGGTTPTETAVGTTTQATTTTTQPVVEEVELLAAESQGLIEKAPWLRLYEQDTRQPDINSDERLRVSILPGTVF